MARRRRPPRKPTGEIRARTLEVGGAAPATLSEVVSFKLPEIKNDAENVVMRKFVEVSQLDCAHGLIVRLTSAKHLPSDHGPDFEAVLTTDEICYFELLEIAPLTGPYESANHAMLIGDLIDSVVEQIEIKIKKYSERPQFRPIFLLLYASHYAFSPGRLETLCIIDTLNALSNAAFEEVYMVLFAHDGNPFVVRLWPFQGRHFTKSQLTGHRRRQMIRAKPEHIVILEDNSDGEKIDVTIRQRVPVNTDLSKIKLGRLSLEESMRIGLAVNFKQRPLPQKK